MIRQFTLEETFLAGVPDYSRLSENEAIHLVQVGARPGVVSNNTSYPIPTNVRADIDVPIGLDKYQTEVSIVSDDDLYALSYDKISSVLQDHREVLQEGTADKAIHAFAPVSNAPDTPILLSTGGDDGFGRKRLTVADIIRAKRQCDDLKWPKRGRRLVLCNEHIEDILMENEAFKQQYQNIPEGKVLKLYGFEIHEYAANPVYNASNTKKAFGAATAGTDRNSSVFFLVGRMFKAMGSTKFYYDLAANNPRMQQNEMNYRLYFIAQPKNAEAHGAIVSDRV